MLAQRPSHLDILYCETSDTGTDLGREMGKAPQSQMSGASCRDGQDLTQRKPVCWYQAPASASYLAGEACKQCLNDGESRGAACSPGNLVSSFILSHSRCPPHRYPPPPAAAPQPAWACFSVARLRNYSGLRKRIPGEGNKVYPVKMSSHRPLPPSL